MLTMTAENFGESRNSIAYKGPSGSGKTTLAASWPTPQIWAYFDKNLKTIRDLVKSGLDAKVMIFDSYQEFDQEFVQPALHRKLEAETLIVDTMDFMAAMIMRDVQGIKPKLAISEWGTILGRLRSVCSDLASTTSNVPDKPSYNIVMNYHLMDVTDDSGTLLKIAPKIPGQFKDELEAYLDTILYCTSEISSTLVKVPGGGQKLMPSKQFISHSVPPNPFITCKGGGLPPRLKGDYQTLQNIWDGKSEDGKDEVPSS